MNPIRRQLGLFNLAFALAAASGAAAAAAPEAATPATAAAEERTVYHVNDMATAREVLVNIANHLAAAPRSRIAVVANGRGIFMLVAGEKDRVGEYSTAISELATKGVRFVACRNSMTQKQILPAALAPGVQIVPAGVAELARLQSAEHYAYIKP